MPSAVGAVAGLGFAATGAYHLWQYRRSARRPAFPGRRADQVDRAAHVFMTVEMVAMVLTGPVPDRWGAQATVLTVVTGWFTVRAVGGGPLVFSHALAAAAMTGMLVPAVGANGPATVQATSAAMPGMPMPHGQILGTHLGALVGGCLLISAAGWVFAAYRARRAATPAQPNGQVTPGPPSRRVGNEPAVGALAYAAMAVGMAAMLLPMR